MRKFKLWVFLKLINGVYNELPLEQMQEIRNDCAMKCKFKEETLRAQTKTKPAATGSRRSTRSIETVHSASQRRQAV